MKLKPIITSLLETDLYKFSMGQAIYHMFPNYTTTWTFKCRNENVVFTKEMVREIKRQVKHFCKLRFTEDEIEYLSDIAWTSRDYIYHLKHWKPNYKDFKITTKVKCGLSIETNGTWLNTSMYEIPVLAIVNEVYYRFLFSKVYNVLVDSFEERLDKKVHRLETNEIYLGNFSDFGLRRRLSAEAQEMMIQAFMDNEQFAGTSNVYLAKKYNIRPIGTMAHEWIMCVGQGLNQDIATYSNYFALKSWYDEYCGLNGIALTDTVTTDCFLKDFDINLATMYSGVRHDSGSPFEWGDKIISHYKKLGIDPKKKTLVFSDNLCFDVANDIRKYFEDRTNVSFGIGTYLTNDTIFEPLNIVMKVTECNGHDVAKISDVEGKCMCKNEEYVEFLKRCIRARIYTTN